eukprot:m.257037 g.257037  ORF g.257037 m.257037 type:complete len:215 (+) comp34941_c0_seq1:243-887(+)
MMMMMPGAVGMRAVSFGARMQLHNTVGCRSLTTHNVLYVWKRNDDAPSIAEYIAKAPVKEEPTWSRMAEAVQGGCIDNDSIYAARLAKVADPQAHIDMIENEILAEMASALGRTGKKCDHKFLLLERQGNVCNALLDNAAAIANDCDDDDDDSTSINNELTAAIHKFNALRTDAEHARRDLVIHRQALGLRQKNNALVEKCWPLPPRRRVPEKY